MNSLLQIFYAYIYIYIYTHTHTHTYIYVIIEYIYMYKHNICIYLYMYRRPSARLTPTFLAKIMLHYFSGVKWFSRFLHSWPEKIFAFEFCTVECVLFSLLYSVCEREGFVGQSTLPEIHTLQEEEKNKHRNTFLKVKNSSCQEYGGNQKNYCTPLKLRSKIQAKKVAVQRILSDFKWYLYSGFLTVIRCPSIWLFEKCLMSTLLINRIRR